MRRIFKYLFHRDHFIVTVSAFLQLWLLGVITLNLDFLNPVAQALENFSITDIFFDIQHTGARPDTSSVVTLVDMTELHDRGDIAFLLEDLRQCDPLYVGVDLIFEGEKDNASGNELLKGAVEGLKESAVFSCKLTDYDSDIGTFTHSVRSFFAEELQIQEAYTNLNDDLNRSCIRDFSLRQVLGQERMLSFPANIAAHFDSSVANLEVEDLLINYRNVCFPVVSYADIAENRDLLEDRIVLVGTMTEEQDMHNTPIGKMSGLQMQAFSLLSLLEHKAIREVPQWLTWLIAFVLCYVLELVLGLLWIWVCRYPESGVMVFLKESNILSILVLFLWMALFCWGLFIMFTRHSIIMSGGLILGLMALVCEGRDLLKAIIKSLAANNPDSHFVKTTLMND